MSTTPLEARFVDPAEAEVAEAWTRLYSCSAQASPFSKLAYAEAVREAFGWTYRLAGVYDGDELAAGVLLFERQLGPYRFVAPPPLTPCTSLLLREPLAAPDVHAQRTPVDALLALLETTYHAVALHLHPSITDVRPFQWAGYQATPLYTYRGALGPTDVLLQQASKGVRRRVRRDGVLYRVAEQHEAAAATAAVARMVAASYARQDRPPPVETQRYTTFLSALHARNLARFFTASSPAGTLEGAQAILTDATAGYLWSGGSNPGPAMTLLTTEIMRVLYEEGLSTFDFAGANTPSIAEFKRSFGARLVPYYRVLRLKRLELRLVHYALRPLL